MLTSRFGALERNSNWNQHVRLLQSPRALPPDEPHFSPRLGIMAPRTHQRTRPDPWGKCFPSRSQGLTFTRELQPNGLHPLDAGRPLWAQDLGLGLPPMGDGLGQTPLLDPRRFLPSIG